MANIFRFRSVAKKLRWCRAWLEKREHLVVSIEQRLFNFHRDSPRAFWACLGLNLVTHIAALLEIFVVLLLLGFNIGVFGALIFEALTKLVNVVGLFNPGNIGTYEGGNLLIARMFRLGADTGLVVAVARRIRSSFWAAIGALCLLALTKEKSRSSSQGASNLKERCGSAARAVISLHRTARETFTRSCYSCG